MIWPFGQFLAFLNSKENVEFKACFEEI